MSSFRPERSSFFVVIPTGAKRSGGICCSCGLATMPRIATVSLILNKTRRPRRKARKLDKNPLPDTPCPLQAGNGSNRKYKPKVSVSKTLHKIWGGWDTPIPCKASLQPFVQPSRSNQLREVAPESTAASAIPRCLSSAAIPRSISSLVTIKGGAITKCETQA